MRVSDVSWRCRPRLGRPHRATQGPSRAAVYNSLRADSVEWKSAFEPCCERRSKPHAPSSSVRVKHHKRWVAPVKCARAKEKLWSDCVRPCFGSQALSRYSLSRLCNFGDIIFFKSCAFAVQIARFVPTLSGAEARRSCSTWQCANASFSSSS